MSRRVKRQRSSVDYARMASGDFGGGSDGDEELDELFQEREEEEEEEEEEVGNGEDYREAERGRQPKGIAKVVLRRSGSNRSGDGESGRAHHRQGRSVKKRDVEEEEEQEGVGEDRGRGKVILRRSGSGLNRTGDESGRFQRKERRSEEEGEEEEEDEREGVAGGKGPQGVGIGGDAGLLLPSPRKGVRGQRSKGGGERWKAQTQTGVLLKTVIRPGFSLGLYDEEEGKDEKGKRPAQEKQSRLKRKKKSKQVMSEEDDESEYAEYGVDADQSEDFVPSRKKRRTGRGGEEDDDGELSDDEVLDPEEEEDMDEELLKEELEDVNRKARQMAQSPRRAHSSQKVLPKLTLNRSLSSGPASRSFNSRPLPSPSSRGPVLKGAPGRLLSKIGYKVPLVAAAAKQAALARPGRTQGGILGQGSKTPGGANGAGAAATKESVVLKPWKPSAQGFGGGSSSGKWEKRELVAILDDAAVLTPATPKPPPSIVPTESERSSQGNVVAEPLMEGNEGERGEGAEELRGGEQYRGGREYEEGEQYPEEEGTYPGQDCPEGDTWQPQEGGEEGEAEEGELPLDLPSAPPLPPHVLYDPF